MEISKNVKYVGVNDHQEDLFEGQYLVPNGMAYNSYIILDEKTAVMDTVDGDFSKEWLQNIEQVLEGRTPDYLVIQHMEPDHQQAFLLSCRDILRRLLFLLQWALSIWSSFSRRQKLLLRREL